MRQLHSLARRRFQTVARPVARLSVEILEDRLAPSANASLIGYDRLSGNWQTVQLDSNSQLQVTSAVRWDPYGLTAVVHGDFNGDGKADVAGWNKLGYWLVGLGDGTQFQTQQWAANYGQGVAWQTFLVGDFNHDGTDDIAMFGPTGGWWVAVSTGTGFQTQRWDLAGSWSSAANWRDFEVGDFNGDGTPDVAGLTRKGAWQVGLSTGNSFQTQLWLPDKAWANHYGWQTQVLGDFDNDGKTDLAGYSRNGQWWTALSTGTSFATPTVAATLADDPDFVSVQAGHFSSAGQTAIAALDDVGNIWMIDTDGDFRADLWAASYRFTELPVRLNGGDYDGDGLEDLAAVTSTGRVTVLHSASTGPTVIGQVALGTGDWEDTFSSDRPQRDLAVKRHTALRPQSNRYFITPEDMAALRKEPTIFAALYPVYKDRAQAILGPLYSALDDHGLAISLAAVVAYQSAYYRGQNDPQGHFLPPASDTLSALLAARKLQCQDYCPLAVQLYRILYPAADDTATQITQLRTGGGPFAHHTQLFFARNGISLLVDPTVALITFADLASLRQGQLVPATSLRTLLRRPEATTYMQQDINLFRSHLVGALVGGGYTQVIIDSVKNL
jgi:hypothetical protein